MNPVAENEMPEKPDTAWAREWNEIQLVFSDGTVSSLVPGGELQVRMVHLARKLLSAASSVAPSLRR